MDGSLVQSLRSPLGRSLPRQARRPPTSQTTGPRRCCTIDAADGEVNNLWIEGGPQWQVAELTPLAGGTPVHITGDANCHAYPPPGDPIGADAVSCDTADGAGGIDRVEINLGDENDVFQIIAADVPITVNGGAGEDTFYDTDRTNVILPVPRIFNGGADNDRFFAGVDSGQPNDYHGDAGTEDKMYYTWRTDAPVKRSQTITLDDVADDGENSEGDNVHSDIEYAFGSDQADVIKGTANGDYLVGNGGADTIDGLGGSDRLFAGDAATNDGDTCDADVLNGGDDEDFLALGGATIADGGAGDDHILTDAHVCPGKSDVASGGTGRDSAEFTILDNPSLANLSVSLDDVANDGVGGTDNYKSDIEDLFGSNYGMTLIGSAGPNSIRGGDGNDLLDGGLGADSIRGGNGIDTVDYSSRAVPVTVTIGVGDEDGQSGENDSVDADIENVRGGSAADMIVGSALDNVLDGGLGADNISGGDGVDAVDYSRRTAAVNVTLNTGARQRRRGGRERHDRGRRGGRLRRRRQRQARGRRRQRIPVRLRRERRPERRRRHRHARRRHRRRRDRQHRRRRGPRRLRCRHRQGHQGRERHGRRRLRGHHHAAGRSAGGSAQHAADDPADDAAGEPAGEPARGPDRPHGPERHSGARRREARQAALERPEGERQEQRGRNPQRGADAPSRTRCACSSGTA